MRKTLVLTLIFTILAVSGLFSAEYKWEYINGVFHHTSEVQEARISEDGKYFYAIPSYLSDVIYKFNMTTGALVDSVVFQTQIKDTINKPRYIKFSRDAKTFIVFNYSQPDNVEIHNINTGETLYKYTLSIYLGYKLTEYFFSNFDFTSETKNLVYSKQASDGTSPSGGGTYEWYFGYLILTNLDTKENTISRFYPTEYIFLKNYSKVLYNEFRWDHEYRYYAKEYHNYYYNVFGITDIPRSKIWGYYSKTTDYSIFGYYNPALSPDESKCIIQTDSNKIEVKNIVDKDTSYNFIDYHTFLVDGRIFDLKFYDNENIIAITKLSLDKEFSLQFYNLTSKKLLYSIPLINLDTSLSNYNMFSIIESNIVNTFIKPTNQKRLLKLNQFLNINKIVSNFSVKDTNIQMNEPIQFINKSYGNNLQYLWDFGDGETSNEENPQHIYKSQGYYTISLKAYNSTDSSVYIRKNYIHVTYYITADFKLDKFNTIDTYLFKPTNLSQGKNLKFKWYLEGKMISEAQNPSILIYKPGKYDVSLIAYDEYFQDTMTKKQYFEVSQSYLSHKNIEPNITYINDNNYNLKANDMVRNNNDLHLIAFSSETAGIYNYSRISDQDCSIKESYIIPKDKDIETTHYEFWDSTKIIMSARAHQLQKFSHKVKYHLDALELNPGDIKLYNFIPNNIQQTFGYAPFRSSKYLYYSILYYSSEKSSIVLSKVNFISQKADTTILSLWHPYHDVSLTNGLDFLGIFDRDTLYLVKSTVASSNYGQGGGCDFEGQVPRSKCVERDFYLNVTKYIIDEELMKNKQLYDYRFRVKSVEDKVPNKQQYWYYDYLNWKETFVPHKVMLTNKYLISIDLTNKVFVKHKYLDSAYLKNAKGFSAVSIAPHNDSLFLAGGHSANGKAALYYVKYPEITPVDSIIFNSLYGNIVDIELTNSGDYILLAENLIAGKKDGLVVLKTRNVKCSVSDKLSSKKTHSLSTLTNGPISIPFDSSDAAITELKLFNSIGEVVMNIPQNKLQIDNNSISFDLRDFNIPDLQTYFYHFSINNQEYYGKFIYIAK
jgi:PKD repeat protein